MSGVRIIAGQYKRRVLGLPRGANIRPTSSRVRESLFAMLHPWLAEARFLDLCAGTGAVGLEAASRGAARVLLVDNDRRCVQAIRANVAACSAHDVAQVWHMDCLRALRMLHERGEAFDIIFADPPYRSGLVFKIVSALARRPELLEENGWLCLEHDPGHPDVAAPPGFGVQSRKSYGDQALTVLRKLPP